MGNESMTDYKELCAELQSLIKGVPHTVANLANSSALLYDRLDRINWAGFYLYDGEKLVLNAFQGKPACIEIPLDRGVCGYAASKRETVVVPNVHKFPGHIACDSASRSEIVVPIILDKNLFGVLDIDSPYTDRFDSNDKEGLEEFVRVLSEQIKRTGEQV